MDCVKNAKLFLLQFQLHSSHSETQEQNENTGCHSPKDTCRGMAHAFKAGGFHWPLSQETRRAETDGRKNQTTWIENGLTAIRHTFRCNVINFVVHRSPVRKFANASEGVGHWHKLTKLVEESNNLNIMIPQLLFLSERGFICQCIVYANIWKHITSYTANRI